MKKDDPSRVQAMQRVAELVGDAKRCLIEAIRAAEGAELRRLSRTLLRVGEDLERLQGRVARGGSSNA